MRLEDFYLLSIHIIYICIYTQECLLFVYVYILRDGGKFLFLNGLLLKNLFYFFFCNARMILKWAVPKEKFCMSLFPHNSEKEVLTEEICIHSFVCENISTLI